MNGYLSKVMGWWRVFQESLARESYFFLVSRVTVLTIYLWYPYVLFDQVWVLPFLLIALFWRRALESPLFWGLLWALLSVDLYHTWVWKANHGWVMWYWLIAMIAATSVRSEKAREFVMVNNARWLLIIIMIVAVFWKVIDPTYMNSNFFEHQFITNPIMEKFTHVVTGMPWEWIQDNQAAQERLFTDTTVNALEQKSNTAAHYAAIFITWWVLAVELIIGFLLLFYEKVFDRIAHGFHIFFIWAAYLGGPILAFAWIIAALGLALTGERDRHLWPWYLITFLVLATYGLPWETIFFDWLGIFPLW